MVTEAGTDKSRGFGIGGWKFWTALPLILLAIGLATTNGHFNILDDEVIILDVASQPASELVKPFFTGVGVNEHPPLSDLLTHWWIKVVPGSLFWLRLPFIACYVGAFVILAALARRLAGPRAAVALAWIALLSPYGFHFGRLLGWFNLMLLLVAALTYCYIRWLESSSPQWLVLGILVATALLYTNYFSWVLIGLMALDAAVFRRPWRWRNIAEAAGALVLLAVLFGPLWRAFFELLRHPRIQVQGSKLAAYIFDMYALLVSESFAPWFFAIGIPVALLCVLCYAFTFFVTRGVARRLFVYFLVLSVALAVAGSINTKRMPFLLAWFFLPLAIAVTGEKMPQIRRTLIGALAIVFAVGWYGTMTARYYASPHFIDGWKDAVALGMQEHAAGGVMVFDTQVASYYLSRACASGPYQSLYRHPDCGIIEAQSWFDGGHPGRQVVAVQGVQYGLKHNDADSYLQQNCSAQSEQHFTRDPSAALKHRLFPAQREPEWRISVVLYDCPSRMDQ